MSNHTNEITVRFSFLRAGSKLSANYKPRTGNYTISGTVVEHEDLDVSHNLINSVVVADTVKGGRATLCFTSREEATKYIKMINAVLAVAPEAQIKVLTTNQIIYNNENGKSLTIFNPDVVELDKITKPIIGGVNKRTAPTDETVAFNYEEELDKVAPKNEYGSRNMVRVMNFHKAQRSALEDNKLQVKQHPEVVQPSTNSSSNSIDKELVKLVLEQVGAQEFARMSTEEKAALIEGLKMCV